MHKIIMFVVLSLFIVGCVKAPEVTKMQVEKQVLSQPTPEIFEGQFAFLKEWKVVEGNTIGGYWFYYFQSPHSKVQEPTIYIITKFFEVKLHKKRIEQIVQVHFKVHNTGKWKKVYVNYKPPCKKCVEV